MKKKLSLSVVIFLFITILSCGSKKETAASIAQKWCDLNAKVEKATTDEEKEMAKQARKKFENEMDAKYKDNEAMKKELEKEVEKCEDASEGK